MSGTSADGIDCALVRAEGCGPGMSASLLCHRHHPYSLDLRKRIYALRGSGSIELAGMALLGHDISLAYADSVRDLLNAANVRSEQICAVAAHGQTLFHQPPLTIQWLDPSLLAYQTDCVVVSDFRRADCAAGGQGAPLVPFADFLLFRHSALSRIILNIGGIANVTCIPAGASIQQVVAFDTGPGNCVSDWLCRRFEPDGPGFDEGGSRAKRGVVNDSMLSQLLASSYFTQPPPKSTDGPAMIQLFEKAMARNPAELFENLLQTSCALTVSTILGGIASISLEWDELIVSGGGANNRAIMEGLRRAAGRKLITTDALGVPTAAREAMAFALLGAATLDGEPSNLPAVTGAGRAVVLGSITPRP